MLRSERLRVVIIILSVLAVFGLSITVLVIKPWQQASPDMIQLRQVESRLALPQSASRLETDQSPISDPKSTDRVVRMIMLYYDKPDVVSSITKNLMFHGWEVINSVGAPDGTLYYQSQYVNRTEQICLITKIDPAANKATERNTITIQSKADSVCSVLLH